MSIDLTERLEIMGKPPGGYRAKDTDRRVRWVERHTGHSLAGTPVPEPEALAGVIENHVGFVPMPMAVAAPLVIDGTYARGEFAVPLCTVEGTLALSMTRGMLAIAMAGGCRTAHYRQALSRSPYFLLPDLDALPGFLGFLREEEAAIREAAEATTRHGRLLRVEAVPVQDWVILDFVYDTADAAGQNMVTLATEAACQHIQARTGYRYYLESGYNSDKKPSRRNLTAGRGHGVIFEVTLPDQVLDFLGVTKEAVVEFQEMATTAAQLIGMPGSNLHVANALTAIYLATGQDAACAAENAVALCLAAAREDGLHCRITLPSLTVGTVGGGTRLPAQRRNLELLGCAEGPHASRKFAEIVAGAVGALEISLLAAVVSGTFAQAHAKYGRAPSTSNGNGNGNGHAPHPENGWAARPK